MRGFLHIWRTALLGLALLGTTGAFADEPPKPAPVMPSPVGPKVKVEVLLVHAEKGDPYVDPKLTKMLSELKTLPYDKFTLIDDHSATLTDGAADVVDFEGGRRMVIHLVSHDEKGAQVRVELMAGETRLLDTTISIHRNRMFYLAVSGQGSGRTVIPVGVRY